MTPSSGRLFLYTGLILSVLVLLSYEILYNYQVRVDYNWLPENDVKYILFWEPMWMYEDFGLGLGREMFKACPVSNCMLTKNRSVLPVEEYDALIFHGVEYKESWRRNPWKRSSRQVYIYFSLESPFVTPSYLKYSYGFFNWTMTYRTDSEIFRPYGRIMPNNSDYQMPTVEDIKKRPKKIAWFTSHCGVASKRDELAKKIAKHMPVDIYGECGDHVCSRDDSVGCYNMMERDYKFYLSFENSVCKDYVTEKMYYILQKNIIPIVYGGANYDKFAPPHSVIDVSKFKTVQELADYLKFLDENPEEYLKYFEWKKSYYSDTTAHVTLCDLCEKLNEPGKKIYYEDVVEWLNYPGVCKTGDSLPPIVFS